MNVIDYALLGIVGVSLLYGLYKGFVGSLLGLIALFAAMFAAYAIAPSVAASILRNESIVDTLIHYTDAASRVGDLDMAKMAVSGLSSQRIAEVVARVGLPVPFDALLSGNMAQQVFAAIGSVSVAEYINQTIVTSMVSILSYVLTFIVAYVAMSLLIGLFGFVFKFPALRQLDAILGGVLGLARGVFLVFILFAVVPVVMTVLPFDQFGDLVQSSRIGSALYQSNVITSILQGHL
ncbi:MAG: CvpA family protein [Clostridia bacterium]|nr:CvpA family protein [Clostridia bacterium]